jgi:hypothetical protein
MFANGEVLYVYVVVLYVLKWGSAVLSALAGFYLGIRFLSARWPRWLRWVASALNGLGYGALAVYIFHLMVAS